MPQLNIGNRCIGDRNPTYFIADISANHDGDLQRAKDLIQMAADSGADAAKFQNFRASHIVSDAGFNAMTGQMSHQSKWEKSVYEVYEDATVPWEWTEILKKECDQAGIDYFSTPYDFEAVDMLDPYVSVFKIGSGDITWPEMLQKVASKQKPVLLATGASDTGEVQRAVQTILQETSQLVLMQCNTNYTGSLDNFAHIHLDVLKTFGLLFPDTILGLSDHTPKHTTVLGAIALGARVVEKHFTDDTKRVGPDHPFSMTPQTWRVMVDRTRELELALGSTVKQVAENEKDTVVIQRRCLRARQDLKAGTKITPDMIAVLRPAPIDGIFPYEISKLENKYLKEDVSLGTHFRWTMFE